VKSIVGDFLEHTRLYYFNNAGNPKVYGGSADMMNRSFDRRLESLFLLAEENLRKTVITILHYNLQDNANSYIMTEDGSYIKYKLQEGEKEINIHKLFYKLKENQLQTGCLF
jgi:polyphosphate kinase